MDDWMCFVNYMRWALNTFTCVDLTSAGRTRVASTGQSPAPLALTPGGQHVGLEERWLMLGVGRPLERRTVST